MCYLISKIKDWLHTTGHKMNAQEITAVTVLGRVRLAGWLSAGQLIYRITIYVLLE